MTRSNLYRTVALVVSGAIVAAFPALVLARGVGPKGAEMMPAFEAIDADKDGSVTEAEIAAFRAAAIAGADANKDGSIDLEELTAFETKMAAKIAQEHANRRMEAQDANGDGRLDSEELLAPPGPNMAISRLDSDGDGALSKAEFSQPHSMRGGHERISENGGDHGGVPPEGPPKE